ncbi:hypothetical protein BCR35DRAFT_311190 [Leucosporidium creatinivorum]|uniref:MATH domain-containing protein n=1 Tax=Leucosporidium creatinivorum TaxID=106004 RepID=A0A1Y2CA77_9BASI|nr:hypothetical protein BCR35DRAFT_311190 [Leucosporidium creatinivorum]
MATLPPLPAHEPPPLARQDINAAEYVETRSVMLEWKVSNLKTLFEQSKGEAKSKCVKSALFDNHRWQIFLYPNSGHEQYCSLYLSCEPTSTEKERGLAERAGWAAAAAGREGLNAGLAGPAAPEAVGVVGGTAGGRAVGKDVKGPWKREGKFKFTFELRSVDRRSTFKQMEANDHAFSDSARNWGYSSFAKRSDAYYNNPSVRLADAFLIVCTIVYSPTEPSPPPLPRLLIPTDLVTAYASLFDDPDYSDIVFRIRPSNRPDKPERRLYAIRKVLAGRCEYFETMFSSGFHESSTQPYPQATTSTAGSSSLNSPRTRFADLAPSASEEESISYSDDEDDDWDEDDDTDVEGDDYYEDEPEEGEEEEGEGETTSDRVVVKGDEEGRGEETGSRASSAAVSDDDEEQEEDVEAESADEEGGRQTPDRRRSAPTSATFVDAPVAPESPIKAVTLKKATSRPTSQDEAGLRRSMTTTTMGQRAATLPSTSSAPKPKSSKPKDTRPRFEVVVTDAAYQSYRSLLHYLYTDSITFAPLSSSYHVARESAALAGTPFPYESRRAYLLANTPFPTASTTGAGGVGPCSAKAIYRLADKIGLNELKERAFDHIVKSLTVQNIPYEVFGSFSSRFEEIKRVEISFLLERWSEAKASPSMKKVFDHLRTGRFPGTFSSAAERPSTRKTVC